jgi:hypothetical protein
MLSAENFERPRCSTCRNHMDLVRERPGEKGVKIRTFECPVCFQLTSVAEMGAAEAT